MRTAFRPLVAAAIEARKQILREFAQVPKEISLAFSQAGRAQGSSFRGTTTESQRANRELVLSARQAAREQREIARGAEREMLQEHRQAIRERQQLDKSADSLQRQRSAAMYREYVQNERSMRRELDSFARRTSHRTTRFLMPEMPIASIAHRAMHGVMRGFGVDPTVEGAFERNIELETSAARISNQSRLAGQEVSPEEIAARVREVSGKYGLKRGATTEALQHFVDTGGDLKTGMASLDKLGERSIVTSTDIGDLAQATADASMHMGQVPDKLNKLFGTIDSLGVQSDRGAIAMREIAKQNPKLASAATMFGGDVAENQVKMGALAQIARTGGAANAAQAATSVVSFVNTLQKGTRLKEFKKAGVEVYNSDNTLRDPFQIIKDAIHATGNDPRKMNALFSDTRSKSVVNAFQHTYRDAGGGARGDAAIDAMRDKLTTGTKITDEDAQRALAARMATTAFRVQQFQNRLDDTAQRVQSALLPALEKLSPIVVQVADVFGSLAKAGLDNPGAAIVAAIVGSIARAGLESGLRAAIERVIMGAGGRGGAVAGTAGVAGQTLAGIAGAASVGLALGVPIAASIYTSGIADVDENMKDIDASARETGDFKQKAGKAKTISPAERQKMRRDILDREEQVKQLKENRNSGFMGFVEQASYYMGGASSRSQIDYTGRGSRIRQIEGDLTEKRKAMAQIEAVKYEAPDEVSRYRAKDPSKTSLGDMQAAFKSGGTAALEKIAVKADTQAGTAAKMLDGQTQTNKLLSDISDKIGPKAGGSNDDPSVPPPAPGGAYE